MTTVISELRKIVTAVPTGLWVASLIFALVVVYDRVADAEAPGWLVGLALLVTWGTVLLQPAKRFLIEPYYIWAEYNFIGGSEWFFLVAVPKLVGVFLATLITPILGAGLAFPVFLVSDVSSGPVDTSESTYRSSGGSRRLQKADKSSERSKRPSASNVSENDGVKYNDKGELVRDE